MSDRNYDENIAEDAGYAAGRVEGEYDNARNDIRRDEQRVENLPGEIAQGTERRFNEGVQDVESIPSNIGKAIDGVAGWLGKKIGGAENDAQRAEQNVENTYNEGRQDVDRFGQGVQNEYNEGRQDVDRFGQNVENSYDQGEQQGRQGGGGW